MFIPRIRKSLKAGYLSFTYDMTYFDLMKIPVRYDIDKKILLNNYNRVKTMLTTPFTNDAFVTLNDDLKRAAYILKIKGVKIEHIDYNLSEHLKEKLKNTYSLQGLKEEINEELETVKNDFAVCIDYDEIISAKNHYTLLYKLIRLDKEIYEKINE
jgi:hypothetical protein